MENLEKRQMQLRRQSIITKMEADCISLQNGESISIELSDVHILHRMLSRIARLRRNKVINLSSKLENNNLTITRHEL